MLDNLMHGWGSLETYILPLLSSAIRGARVQSHCHGLVAFAWLRRPMGGHRRHRRRHRRDQDRRVHRQVVAVHGDPPNQLRMLYPAPIRVVVVVRRRRCLLMQRSLA